MEQTVINIGNSAGVIIPKKVMQTADVKLGDTVLVEVKSGKITLEPVKKIAGGVDAKFAQTVDTFIERHKDVLQALSKR